MKKRDKMKTVVISLGAAIVVIYIFLAFFMDREVRVGVETVGPRITGTAVTLEDSSLSIFMGSGEISGLVIGNPDDFYTPAAISIGIVTFHVDTTSYFGRYIVLNRLELDGPEITYEAINGRSNIAAIKDNIERLVAREPGAAEDEAAGSEIKTENIGTRKRIFIKNLIIRNGKINISGVVVKERPITIPLPDVEIKDMGSDPQSFDFIKNKWQRLKRTEKMRSVTVPDISLRLINVISDAVVSAIADSGITFSAEVIRSVDNAVIERKKRMEDEALRKRRALAEEKKAAVAEQDGVDVINE